MPARKRSNAWFRCRAVILPHIPMASNAPCPSSSSVMRPPHAGKALQSRTAGNCSPEAPTVKRNIHERTTGHRECSALSISSQNHQRMNRRLVDGRPTGLTGEEGSNLWARGMRWITWVGGVVRSGCSRSQPIESWEWWPRHRDGDRRLDPCRLARHYTSRPSAD